MTLRPRSLHSRVVGVFALGCASVLVLTGAVLYLGFDSQLDDAIDQALRDRATEIASDVAEGHVQIRRGEPFAELLDAKGQVLDATAVSARRMPVLSPRELARAARGEVVVERGRVTGLGDRGRILARPAQSAQGNQLIVVVGESLDTVVRARERLGWLLGIIAPLQIGVIAWCGSVLAGAALRPVRQLTEEAEAISLRQGGERLPQPPGDDEIAHLGRTLNAMLGRIEASIAHERAFVDDASHELRTPLSIVRGELELALEQPATGAAVEQALRSALQETERLGQLTENLLVLARADRGGLDARLVQVDWREVASVVARRADGSGPGVEVVGGPAFVTADPVLLERLVENLLSNARRHAASRVRAVVSREEGWVRFTVADDGPGFPPAFVPLAFERFTRADADRGRDHGGAGLGLAIVAAVVRAHGGRVAAGNGGPLGGGRVDVWLPDPAS